MAKKSRDAFRTISEVSEALDTPAHVLRFWESKFKQIKPVKRAGGRRYYRPDDLALLAAIKDLLHEQGHSIKDAQKLIREDGVKVTVARGHTILGSDEPEDDAIDAEITPPAPPSAPVTEQSDLFAGQDLPDMRPPQPKPRIEIISASAVPDPAPETEADEETEAAFAPEAAAPETKQAFSTAITLPELPGDIGEVPSRLIAALGTADPALIKANATRIAPLIAKLTSLRDEMRHPW